VSGEAQEIVPAAEADRLVSMMADQQIEFDRFRENVNARLAAVERRQVRRSSSFFDLDFEKIAGMVFMFILAAVLTKVAFAALAFYKKRGFLNDDVQVSET
jgi:hypothetical protein